ncbi:M23 family metallopeptidase [Cellulosilyticum lentocellum]|uniref:Peptidase M23 n=1 Tax=Cellulosilyticum lentocellum (strain ATCC 49066 / DSM 5427 / NCIMB 11756 / RHM5) TaxID=642492 RepID=F2JP64_CELLD|nr:M23 family metallopeptidase [Cellulosilyticum lentocellum]ADZ84803.1 Peptidase M23 [Cellulosilyticum lentocellum DSM 5427]
MKQFKKVSCILLMLLVCSTVVQAEEITPVVTNDQTTVYRDTSEMKLDYIQIPGFLVSPLQQKGEVLAPFNQSRIGYFHQGIDIRAAEGTPIFASADGTVTKAAPDSKGVTKGGGHMIFIDYGNGVEARYMHLSAYGVKAGDHVKAGDIIGFTGNTGDSSAPHLHFEYYIGGQAIDPAFIFEASGIIGDEVVVPISQKNNEESFLVIQG